MKHSFSATQHAPAKADYDRLSKTLGTIYAQLSAFPVAGEASQSGDMHRKLLGLLSVAADYAAGAAQLSGDITIVRPGGVH